MYLSRYLVGTLIIDNSLDEMSIKYRCSFNKPIKEKQVIKKYTDDNIKITIKIITEIDDIEDDKEYLKGLLLNECAEVLENELNKIKNLFSLYNPDNYHLIDFNID